MVIHIHLAELNLNKQAITANGPGGYERLECFQIAYIHKLYWISEISQCQE